jgi:hypothetical protein
MLKNIIFISVLFLVSEIGFAQELYIPRDVKQAYKNQTRDLNGIPGKNYWQNKAVYHIKLKVNPPEKTIYGSEEITYTNNSPDTLKVLNFKVIMNIHKSTAARPNPTTKNFITSGVTIDKYFENDKKIVWNSADDQVNKAIVLSTPIPPKGNINIKIDWHYDISNQKDGREGAIFDTSYYIAYFYPRIAVYDDYLGWDAMVFTGSKEFYNDFNDYVVEVTVPKNFIVWATGDLQNIDEVLQPLSAKRLKESMKSDSIIQIANQNDLKKGIITAQNDFNTWKWKANHITDVALAVSNTYNWDAGSVIVDKKTGRRASVQAAYDEKSADFNKMTEYGKNALHWFSNNYPGVPYPFSKSTIFRGYADMEYPMMVNDNTTGTPAFTRFIAEHEIAHTYFPFYMGINETRFPFMDEGWATFFEYMIGVADLKQKKEDALFKIFRVNTWINDKNMEEDLPIITPANVLTGIGNGNNEYGKAALGYLALKDLLGDDLFKKSLHGYMERWNGKHPMPWDFFYSFNNISGQNLNWFWKSWFFSNHYTDMELAHVKIEHKKIILTINNIGGMPMPFDIMAKFKSGEVKTIHHVTPKVWEKNPKQAIIEIKHIKVKDIEVIVIDGGIFMESDIQNNMWKKDKKK